MKDPDDFDDPSEYCSELGMHDFYWLYDDEGTGLVECMVCGRIEEA